MAFVIFVRYASKCQNMAALKIESFMCNHSINAVLTAGRQHHKAKNSDEIQSKNRQTMIEIVPECH